jgi:putative GTP pyrophosphokinase
MAKEISKTQVDRLGDRIKRGQITEEDLRLLDRYRRSFTPSYEVVVVAIRDKLGLEPTGRPAKSTTSIVDKLKRESIRLTQIQDIAGCRIIVAHIAEQESVIQSLKGLFPQSIVIDRRAKPSHGYRAVHVVANQDGKLIEIQVRTALQHAWAEMSEKFSDVMEPSIKYGGGDATIQRVLQDASQIIDDEEASEKELYVASLLSPDEISDDLKRKIDAAREIPVIMKPVFYKLLLKFIEAAPKFKGRE